MLYSHNNSGSNKVPKGSGGGWCWRDVNDPAENVDVEADQVEKTRGAWDAKWTVPLWQLCASGDVQFEKLPFIKSYASAQICFPFKNCAVSIQCTSLFWEGTCIINKMSPKQDWWGANTFPHDFERPLLAPRRDFLMLTHKATMAQNALWSEHMQAFSFAYPPSPLYQHRLNSLIIRDPMESDSLTLVLPVCEPLWTWQWHC